jgi:glutathione S-transferase
MNFTNKIRHINETTKIKVLYWFEGGIAEPIRMALRYRGVKFEDIYITKEEWKNGEKEKQPWGKLPVVTIEKNNSKEILCQSKSILKYFGNRLNLYDNLYINRYKIDQYIDTMEDTYRVFVPTFKLELEEKLKEREKLCKIKGEFWYWLDLWNKKVKEYDYLVNSKMTIADLYVFTIFNMIFSGWLDGVSIDLLNNFPKLKKYLSFVKKKYKEEVVNKGLNKKYFKSEDETCCENDNSKVNFRIV